LAEEALPKKKKKTQGGTIRGKLLHSKEKQVNEVLDKSGCALVLLPWGGVEKKKKE